MSFAPTQLDSLLKVNLASYLEANSSLESDNTQYYRVRRELAIARMALENGTKAYMSGIAAVQAAISVMEAEGTVSPESINRLLNLLRIVEDKSAKVINAANKVVQTAKSGAEIESLLSNKLDAVQIYSILTQLPQLLQSVVINVLIEQSSSDPQSLAAIISNKFSSLIEEQVSVLSYSGNGGETDNDKVSGNGILESQITTMLNSVPHAPDKPQVVEAGQLPDVLTGA